MELVAVIAAGFFAGIVSGLFGVGGGIVFVPTLAFLVGLSQVHAEATSLVAIIPVAIVGAWRQRAYGNVVVRDGMIIGLLAFPGAFAAAALANALPERGLEMLFAGLCIGLAIRMLQHIFSESAS